MRKALSEQKCEILKFSENTPKEDHCKERVIRRVTLRFKVDKLCQLLSNWGSSGGGTELDE